MKARLAAVRVLTAVIQDGRSLPPALERIIPGLGKGSDAALVKELCYGTLRRYQRLQFMLEQLLRKPLKRKDIDLQCLLLLGLYQLSATRIPDYAAVGDTVGVSRDLGKPWAKGLVNGVLRNFQRQQAHIEQQLAAHPEAFFSHPEWLLDRLRADWPEQWQDIVLANNQRPPMSIRINRSKVSLADYSELLAQAEFGVKNTKVLESGLTLEQAVDVKRLPGFDRGLVSVQDLGAQWAAQVLDVHAGMRVLDACAAPGGKTAHILERTPDVGQLQALDIDQQRLQRVRTGLTRLGFIERGDESDRYPTSNIRLLCADAADPQQWWDGQPFDRVLLDAPCSATGVIRRHPDIKVLRRDQDIEPLVQRQQQILQALWPTVAVGGMLCYVTCSVLKVENEFQIQQVISDHADAEPVPLNIGGALQCSPGYQILPGSGSMDGFYYAGLRKV